ncbi:hypothetical protein MA16_Dca019665 [Dendrobium catenatum]|uniref:Uncharacterized protein n=1 Tax=Dendrobium catenatum TaxID=906689 RepID=A0A2I0X1A8_9ASPA|nr:hypothetical protein MA16_Dca019665 [Dendrobium catenatum]
MVDPELDYGIACDEEENVNILQSTFFDFNPKIDNSIEEYVDRIIFTLSEAVEEQLANVQWQIFSGPRQGFERYLAAEALRVNDNDTQKALDLLTDPEKNCALQQKIDSKKRSRQQRQAAVARAPIQTVDPSDNSASITVARDPIQTGDSGDNSATASSMLDFESGSHELDSQDSAGSPNEDRDEEMEDVLAKGLTGDAYADYDLDVSKEGEAIAEYLALLESATGMKTVSSNDAYEEGEIFPNSCDVSTAMESMDSDVNIVTCLHLNTRLYLGDGEAQGAEEEEAPAPVPEPIPLRQHSQLDQLVEHFDQWDTRFENYVATQDQQHTEDIIRMQHRHDQDMVWFESQFAMLTSYFQPPPPQPPPPCDDQDSPFF